MAFMTAYYTFRLYFRVFEGPRKVPAAPAHGHGHDAPMHQPTIMVMATRITIMNR